MVQPPSTPLRIIVGSVLLVTSLSQAWMLRSIYAIITTGSLLLLAATVACLYAVIRDDAAKRTGSGARRRSWAVKQLSFATPSAWSAVLVRQTWEETSSNSHSSPNLLSSRVLSKLRVVLGLIRSSFISPWYSRISPSAAFPNAVDDLILRAIANIARAGEPVDWSRLVMSRVLPILKGHLQHYRSVEHLVSKQASPSAIDPPLPLPKNAHPALSGLGHGTDSSSPAIESHLRAIMARLVETALPEGDQSAIVTIIVRELVLGSVLLPIFDMLCDGDFWNRTIEEKGGRYLQERKQVDQFLTALSTLPAATPGQTPRKSRGSTMRGSGSGTTSTISAASSGQQFDAFLKSIAKVDSLGEARRLRADVDRELRLARASLDPRPAAEQTSATSPVKATKRSRNYVARLDRAAAAIDAKISSLTAQNGKAATRALAPSFDSLPVSVLGHDVSLQAILSDPSSLAYWLEFMERRGRSRLVQCWLTLEGVKDPLDPLDVVGLQSPTEEAAAFPFDPPFAGFHGFAEDVALLFSTHFGSDTIQPLLPTTSVADIRAFVASKTQTITISDVRKVKLALQVCQSAIFDRMEEEDWPHFKKSELSVKAVSDLARSSPIQVLQPALPLDARPPLPRLSVSATDTTDPSISRRDAPRKDSGAANEASRPPSGVRSPPARTALALLNSNSTPRSVAAAASLSLTPPMFERNSGGFSRRATDPSSPVLSMPPTPSLEQSSTLPGPPSRKASQLDFLISDVGADSFEPHQIHKRTLFEDEDEAEVGSGDDMDHEDENTDAERMEAIQAALTEIISSSGASSTLGNQQPPSNMSASMVLLSQAQKQHERASALGSGKPASRSAEDLSTTRYSRSPAASTASSRLPSAGGSFAPRPTTTRQSSASRPSNAGARSKLFEDDPESDDPEIMTDTEANPDEGVDPVDARGTIQLAGPGDLHLGPKIARLQDRIQDLVKQDELLLSLIAQAELTGSSHELRILKRSQSALRLEQRTILFQKAQFEQQEEENRLSPRRTRVSIPSTEVVTESDGKQVVRYHVRIYQIDVDVKRELGGSDHRTTWTLIRRFNDFWELDRGLREHLGSSAAGEGIKKRMAKMPEKTLVTSLSPSFVENRRSGLERYLQAMIGIEDLCQHPLVLSFFSSFQSSSAAGQPSAQASMATVAQALAPHNIVKSLYRTMATSLDDSQLGPSTLDMMYTTLSRQLNEVAGGFGGVLGSLSGIEVDTSLLPANILKAGAPYTPTWLRPDPLASLLPAASSPSAVAAPPTDDSVKASGAQDPPRLAPIGGETGSTAFSAPICDLFIELFELKESNWIRRQAIVIILQQLLGSTIERKVRDSFKKAMSEDSFETVIGLLQDTLWPGGERRPPSEPRSEEDKARTRYRASKTLPLLIPDVVANMVGRGNAKRASRRIFEMLQDKRLNQNLVLCLLDEVVDAVLPPVSHGKSPRPAPAAKTGG